MNDDARDAKREWFRTNHHAAGPNLHLYFVPSSRLIVSNAVLFPYNAILEAAVLPFASRDEVSRGNPGISAFQPFT